MPKAPWLPPPKRLSRLLRAPSDAILDLASGSHHPLFIGGGDDSGDQGSVASPKHANLLPAKPATNPADLRAATHFKYHHASPRRPRQQRGLLSGRVADGDDCHPVIITAHRSTSMTSTRAQQPQCAPLRVGKLGLIRAAPLLLHFSWVSTPLAGRVRGNKRWGS